MAPEENRLGQETSPYLRQHRFDPVDWYPWGEEALSRARDLDRPLFLSIGYSACHWCHVMAHESFADEATATHMNETVVAVKVDREERPDVDAIYMESVVAATGQGGWPISVFATPDGRPFFAGTYFPASPRTGLPSFRQVLAAVADVWRTRRDEIEAQADKLAGAVAERLRSPSPGQGSADEQCPDLGELGRAGEAAVQGLIRMADTENGGFGRAPKFPQPLLLDLLLRAEVAGTAASGDPSPLAVVTRTLEAMASGGIYDQLGGGFSRYSVDDHFLVPHFEKMLYDQALLARVYLHAWQLTADERWRQVLDETLAYVLRDLRLPSGGLASAEDADSEGEEGLFYLWTRSELIEAAGEALGDEAAEWYGASEQGNFEGRNILHLRAEGELLRPPRIEQARRALLARRSQRIRPGLDDKVITEWNALACSVLAEAGAATRTSLYRESAEQIAALLLGARAENGGRTPRLVGGRRPIDGVAGDCAGLLEALVRLFELTGEKAYLDEASSVADELLSAFCEEGVVYTSRSDGERLVVRPTEGHDGVIPSAASTAAIGLARLGALLGDEDLMAAARRIVASRSAELLAAPAAFPELLLAAELVAGAGIEVVAVGAGVELLPVVRSRFLPTALYCWQARVDEASGLPLLMDRTEEALYICRAGACRLPAHDAEQVLSELSAVLGGGTRDGS